MVGRTSGQVIPLLQTPQWFPIAFRVQSKFSAAIRSVPDSTCFASLSSSHDLQLLLDAVVQQNPTTFPFPGNLCPQKPTAFAYCTCLFLPGVPFPHTALVPNCKSPFLMFAPALHSLLIPCQGRIHFLVFYHPWCFLRAWHPSLSLSLLLSFFFPSFIPFFFQHFFIEQPLYNSC